MLPRPPSAKTQLAPLHLTIVVLGGVLALRQLLVLRSGPWIAHPSRWSSTDPLAAVVWVAWTLAVGTALWLLFSVVISLAARLLDIGLVSHMANRLAMPAVRRLTERVTAASIVVSTFVAPSAALAQDTPPIPIVAVVESPEAPPADPSPPIRRVPTVGMPRQIPIPGAGTEPEPGASALLPGESAESASPTAPAQHTVRPGESLWTISCDTLARHLGHRPTDAETAGYWRAVIDANAPTLRSGDPDLIHPGEVIALPDPA